MSQNLALKYRPQTLEELVGQPVTVKLLQSIVRSKNYSNAYLFAGNTGSGKTTASRCFAKAINKGQGNPIEINASTNNGIDDVRAIIASASQRSIDSEYKVIVLDECQMMTKDAWNAFLKLLEEPPAYTIFIFCTTDPNKIPSMILNRVQRYNFSAIPQDLIYKRLIYICEQEHFINYEKTCDLISKIVHGCMRDAIMKLEQCAMLSTDLSLENVKPILNNLSYENMFKLTWLLQDKNEAGILTLIDELASSSTSLKDFINTYLEFILELTKYILFKNINLTTIPSYLATEENPVVQQTVNFENAIEWFNKLVDLLLTIKTEIKYDTSYISTIKAYLLRGCR